jgi:bacillithiol synthase
MSAARNASEPKASRVITEALGGSRLSLAVQRDELPSDLRVWRPRSTDAWKDHVERIRPTNDAWLTLLRPALAPSGEAAERLARVGAGRGFLVTTGQQAGLFGGPLYTLAKALSALALADELERQTGFASAPVFWAATDDADFLEACVAHVADANGLRELRLAAAPPPGTTMAHTPLGDVRPLLAELRAACGSAAYSEYFEAAREAFTSERLFGDAYVRLLRTLLEPLGIAVLDSSHDACRAAARPVLDAALVKAAAIARATGDRATAIRRAGFEPQVEDDRGLSLVFTVEHGVKQRVSVADAAGVARANPASLAPNVLLRPVVERAIMPTVAYVAGPGELAYFTQANAVAAALEQEPVVGVPRWSCTVIEPFADRALKRLGVGVADVRDRHALERRLATASLPADVADAWKRLEAQMHQLVKGLGETVARAALMPPPVIEGLDRSLSHRLSRAERRLIAAAKRKDDRVRHDIDVACGAIFPNGHKQERVLSYIPMLARGGDDLLADMRAAAVEHAKGLVRSERPRPVATR